MPNNCLFVLFIVAPSLVPVDLGQSFYAWRGFARIAVWEFSGRPGKERQRGLMSEGHGCLLLVASLRLEPSTRPKESGGKKA